MKYYIRVRTQEQLRAVLDWGKANALLADPELWKQPERKVQLDSEKKDAFQPICYLCLPDVARQHKIRSIEEMLKNCPLSAGVVIKNIDEFGLLAETRFPGPVIGDSFLYTYNLEAAAFYRQYFPSMELMLSDELTDQELKVFLPQQDQFIYKIYGYQQLMTTNQCISRNYTNCREKKLTFQDERGNQFFALTNCGQCMSSIYNGQCTYMLDKLDEIPFEKKLLDFTVESQDETAFVLNALEEKQKQRPAGITRGHHYKGVD